MTTITVEDSDFVADVHDDGTVQLSTNATCDEYYHIFTNLAELKLLVETLESLPECKA